MMIRLKMILFVTFISCGTAFFAIPLLFAATMGNYTATPPFVFKGSDANVMLDLSVETPMQGAAYNDQPQDLNGDGDYTDTNECSGRVNDGGTVGKCYSKTKEYLGIFDPNKAYSYSGGRFVPAGSTNASHESPGYYSGNFLNWATMTAIDEFRWALTGGRRTTDTTAETVVQRANMALSQGHSWYPVKVVSATRNVAPNTVTPFPDAKIYIYNHNYLVDIGTTWGGHELAQDLNVQAKVCVASAGLEDNCASYNNGAYYKPEGLIQNNAHRMRFAVMSYTLDNSQSRGGGVLRSNMKYVGPTLPDGSANSHKEWDTDGLLIINPESAAEGNSGVVNYINKFGAGGYKSYDPVGELFYECLNFFKNRGPTAEYSSGLTTAQKDNFPVITDWDDPIEYWCQKNYIIGINDANPWLDKKLPGTYFTATPFNGHALIGSDYGQPSGPDTSYSVTALTNIVGDLQGITGTSRCIGCTALNCDMAANNKIIPALGQVMGTCPGVSKENSYYVAGLAYYANTFDIRSDLDGRQTVSTFMIDTQEYNSTPLVGEMNMLWLTGKYGGFVESDKTDTNGDGNVYEPNLSSEWDADSDGEPDNYVLANDPQKLIDGLSTVFNEINNRTSSATAASVISGSKTGEGAVYQSVFYPEMSDKVTPVPNTIAWTGSIHAVFVDSEARLREDTNNNQIMDDADKIIVFRRALDDSMVVDKYSINGAETEITTLTLPAASTLAGKYFTLYTVGESFYIWFSVDGAGSDPAPATLQTGINVALLSTDSATDVATKTVAALNTYSGLFTAAKTTNIMTVTNTIPGAVTDSGAGTSGVTVVIAQQGAGLSTQLTVTGTADDIAYLWKSDSWLNGISDTDIVTQRAGYTNTTPGRYIFTFVDEDEDMIAASGEQVAFEAPSLPSLADLADPATIYPYIPVNSDTVAFPSFVSLAGGNLGEFLEKQSKRVVDYIRGADQPDMTMTGGTLPAFRSRQLDLDSNGTLDTTWRLGDIVYSSPTVVTTPSEGLHLLYKDMTYATFAEKYQYRRTMVYAGANDGMLHAFNGGFYEDRFDVYPATPDKKADVQFLLQPKDTTGATITSGYTPFPLGAELWAYVPYNLLPHLYWLTQPDYSHVYYVDLKPRVFDAKIFTPESSCSSNPASATCIHPGGWGTILVGGMRLGGGAISADMDRTDGDTTSTDRTMSSAYFVLDVTNPEEPPAVLGEIHFPHLGYTTCYPTVAAIKDKTETVSSPNKWYLVFGSGPAESDGRAGTNSGASFPQIISAQKAKLYVVDLGEMAVNKRLVTLDTTGTPTIGTPSASIPGYFASLDGDKNSFISDPVTVDIDLDYKADAIYFGTVSYALSGTTDDWGGKLRRIVIDNQINTTLWDGDSVLLDLDSLDQPITAAPSVGLDTDDNLWVYFGTGRYFIRNDALISTQQSFYGVKEPKDSSTLLHTYAQVNLTSLYDATDIEVSSSSALVNGGGYTNTPWTTFVNSTKAYSGWYYDFPDALERNIGQASLVGDILTFTTYVPSNDICEYEGSSYLYAMYYLTGTAPETQIITDVTNPSPTYVLKRISLGAGMVSKPSIHVGEKDGSTVFVQTSDGSILSLQEKNPGTTRSGTISWQYR